MEVSNPQALDAALLDLPEILQRDVAWESSKAAAHMVANLARGLARVKTGALKGSIKVQTRPPTGLRASAVVNHHTVVADKRYGYYLEYGFRTGHGKGKKVRYPFLYPAVAENRALIAGAAVSAARSRMTAFEGALDPKGFGASIARGLGGRGGGGRLSPAAFRAAMREGLGLAPSGRLNKAAFRKAMRDGLGLGRIKAPRRLSNKAFGKAMREGLDL